LSMKEVLIHRRLARSQAIESMRAKPGIHPQSHTTGPAVVPACDPGTVSRPAPRPREVHPGQSRGSQSKIRHPDLFRGTAGLAERPYYLIAGANLFCESPPGSGSRRGRCAAERATAQCECETGAGGDRPQGR